MTGYQSAFDPISDEERQAAAASLGAGGGPAEEDDAEKAALARQLYSAAVTHHPLLDRYLASTRGIPKSTAGWPESVRFHWALPFSFRTGRPLPTLLLAKTNRAGEIVGLHAVFLGDDGRKAAVEVPKKSFGRGGVVVVRGTGDLLLACEGPEDALTLAVAMPKAAVICTAGAGTLGRIAAHLPVGVDRVVLVADRDNAGANAVGKAVLELARVGVTALVARPPEGVKDANALLQLSGIEAVRAMIAAARPEVLAPLPLFPALLPAEEYPWQALGGVLARAAGAIARKVQVSEAVAAQSVLAVASLAAQAHADVLMPFGQSRPLSLCLVTVAGSGDRKSTADNEALWPIHRREKALREDYDRDLKQYKVEFAAWSAEKRKIEGARIGFEERRQKLSDLGPEPEHPLSPYLTISNLTVEGLLKTWVRAHAALGVFTAEGGQFTGGHGMSEERRLESAGVYSELWDGKPVKRVRALDGATVLVGRRLAIHLMVQPDAAATFFCDRTLRDQGFLSRILIAAPDSIAGRRFYRDVDPGDDAAIRAYGARILSILERREALAEGKANELQPRAIPLSAEAVEAWQAFFDHVEEQSAPGGELASIRDFAAKAAEHAARIAGVLTIIENVDAAEIGVDAMAGALTIADWYVAEALRLQQAARTDEKLLRAKRLLDWLREQPGEITFRDLLQRGPALLRTKEAAEATLGILAAHGWVVEVSDRPRIFRLANEGGVP